MIKEIIAQASVEGKRVQIHYRKGNGELSERVIGDIVSSDEFGEGYINAFCHMQNDRRTFRIDRIIDARIIDDNDFIPTRLIDAPVISVEPQPHRTEIMPLPVVPNEEPVVNQADPVLQQLCKYYLHCLALENANSVSIQKLVDENAPQFFEINTPYIDGINREEIVEFITSNTRQRRTALVGYPVMVSENKLIPLLLYQVTADYGTVDMALTPFVNKAIINLFVNDGDEQMQELLFLEEQLGLNADGDVLDTKSVASLLRTRRPDWPWQEVPNPDIIVCNDSISKIGTNGIYNRCILLQADLGNYTVGLEAELNALSKLSQHDYVGTALYQWLYGEVGYADMEQIQKEELLEVLNLNTEQDEAIRHALNAPLTIVTGPPGTGKSQVVANLIVNLAHKGKNAVFSSKNNKAVDVVEQRTNAIGERPIMIRLGGSRDFSRIAEYLRRLLHAPQPTPSQRQEFESAKRQYDKLLAEKKNILKQQQTVVSSCNELTRTQEDISGIKDKWIEWKGVCNKKLEKNFIQQFEELNRNWETCKKDKQTFWIRLFWPFVKKRRMQYFKDGLVSYNSLQKRIHCEEIDAELFDDSSLKEQETSLKEYRRLCDYKDKLDRYKENNSFEDLDVKLAETKKRLSVAARTLWNKWLTTSAPQIPDIYREQLASFLSRIELNDGNITDNQLMFDYRRIERLLSQLMPICAVTSLSARGRLPFIAGCYDLVIIDEASQCDIASMIPLLYRAKRAVIIGDPHQLNHITTMTRHQDHELVAKYGTPALWSYCVVSLFDLSVAVGHRDDLVHLRDHHRSHANIIEFSNREYYQGTLRVATDYSRLKFPFGSDKSVVWKDVVGTAIRPNAGSAYNEAEIDAVIGQLKELTEGNFVGSIGVVTPFKRQAELITYYLRERHVRLYNELVEHHDFIAATAHKFQGDERDVIIFSPVVSNGAPQGTLNFLSSTPNLFNVAITRARACLIFVGNKSYCQHAGVQYLSDFANYYDSLNHARTHLENDGTPQFTRIYPTLNTTEVVTEWETKLYTALYDKGIRTIPQYKVDRYYVDLAYTENDYKLAIEVGEEVEYNNEQSYALHLRNTRLIEMGWDVIRFMPYQVKDDLEWCVLRVLSKMTQHN